MHRKQPFFLFLKLLFVGLCLIWSAPSAALKESTSSKLIEYLAVEKVNLTVTNSNLRSFSTPITKATYTEKKTWIVRQQKLIIAKIETLNAFLSNQEKKHHELQSRLKQFKQSSSTASDALMLQESVNQIQAFIQLNDKAIELIEANLTLAYQYQKALYQHDHELILWQAKEVKKQTITSKKAAIAALEITRTNLYEKNIALEQEKKPDLHADAKGLHDESTLFLNNQQILLVDYQMQFIRLEITLAEAEYKFLNKKQEVKALESILEVYVAAEEKLGAFNEACQDMKKALEAETGILSSHHDKQALQVLYNEITAFTKQINTLKTLTQKALEETHVVLKKQRVSRQRFADYKQASWDGMLQQILQIPVQAYQYLQTLFVKTLDYYLWEDTRPQVFFWGMLVLSTIFFIAIRRLLRPVTQDKIRSRFSGHLYDGALLLFYRSLPQFLIVTLLIVGLLLNQVMFVQFKLLFHLLLIWLVYRQLNGIARLALLERVSDVPQHEMTLYRRFKWLFFMGAWATGLMILGQELPLSFILQDVFNRLFMLFLLAIAWVLWKSKDILPKLFYLWLHANKRPFRHLLSFLSFLIPISLLTTAMIGLFGYIHFAWVLARYQAYFLLVLTGYVLLRELLSDFLDLLSEKMVSKLNNGW
jgi:potassium-dependent mechanosensitive channel